MEHRRRQQCRDGEKHETGVERKQGSEDLSRRRPDVAHRTHAAEQHAGIEEAVDPTWRRQASGSPRCRRRSTHPPALRRSRRAEPCEPRTAAGKWVALIGARRAFFLSSSTDPLHAPAQRRAIPGRKIRSLLPDLMQIIRHTFAAALSLAAVTLPAQRAPDSPNDRSHGRPRNRACSGFRQRPARGFDPGAGAGVPLDRPGGDERPDRRHRRRRRLEDSARPDRQRHLRRRGNGRHLEVDKRRRVVDPGVRLGADRVDRRGRRSRRRTPTSCGWAPASRTTCGARRGAPASTSRPTAESRGRRRCSPGRSTSAGSSSTRAIRTSCTSPRSDRSGRRAASVASTRRPTAERRGRTRRRSASTPASATWRWIRRTPTSSTRRRSSASGASTGSCPPAPKAGSTRRWTARIRGLSSTADFRAATSGGSA